MNRRLTVCLVLCMMALAPCSARAELVRDEMYRKNEKAFYETDTEVATEMNGVMAKCRLDLVQYIDEHPQLSESRTQDVIYERTSLCMQASGYPAGPPKPTDGAAASKAYSCRSTWDRNARIRKRWAAGGRDVQWLDQFISETPYSGRDQGCAR